MRVRPNALVVLCLLALVSNAPSARAGANVPYVIVTDASLAPAFAPLAAAHTAAGLTAEVHTVQDIVAAYPVAADDAERIRRFLIDAHANLGTRFVLLGGDDPVVPIRRALLRLSAASGFPDVLLPTDQYYACLAGTWNADGDANWGELPYPTLGEPGDDVSHVPDLAVGRAPVKTLAQAQVFVAKSLAALAAQDGAKPVSALLAANALFVGTPSEFDKASFMEALLPILAAHPATHVARLYQLWTHWPGAFPETRQSVLDSLEHGYDLAVLDGQGGVGQFQAGNYPADLISAADLAVRTNATPTFALLVSAFTTQPGPGSIGAAWMNDALGGATSVIGPSDIQLLSIGEAFAKELVHQAFELHVPTQGEALQATIAALPVPFVDNTRLTTQGNLLYGDPALAWPGSLEGGPTPALLSLADADTGPGEARLSWYAAGVDVAGARVERRDEASDWAAVGAPAFDGEGLLTFRDEIASGGRYGYRLRIGSTVSAETWLTIPGRAGLALAGFTPNPARGAMRVSLTLASSEPATLEVVSVAGRRVAWREVGDLGPGAHVVDVGGGDAPAGVYWIRLAQGASVRIARGVVTR